MRTSHFSGKKWLLSLLSLTLTGFMMFAGMNISPAAAAAPVNEMTLDGITMQWTKADMSDVVITETPGKANKLPYGLTAGDLRDIAAEGAGVSFNRGTSPGTTNRTLGGISVLAEPNGCSYSPDRWFKANFKPTCDNHDRCYASNSSKDRLTCDQTFHSGLNRACYVAYSRTTVRLNTCYGVAATYYAAVRNFGSGSYKGKGKNN